MTTDEVLIGARAVSFDRALRVATSIDGALGTRLSLLKPEERLPLLRLRVVALAFNVSVVRVVEIIQEKYARRGARGLGLPLANLTGDAALQHARSVLQGFAASVTMTGKISRCDDAEGYATQREAAKKRAALRPYRGNPWVVC